MPGDDGTSIREDGRWPEAVAFLGTFVAYGARPAADGTVWLAYWDGGRPAEVGLRVEPDGRGIRVFGDVAQGRRVLGLAVPVAELWDRVEAWSPDDPVAALVRRWRGLRPVLFPDVFEGFAWAILGQQITVGLAARLKARVAEAFGSPWRGGFRFPPPAVLGQASPDRLRGLGLSGAKARALVELAARLADGWDPRGLAEAPLASALVELTALWGVGRWTAEYVLARVLGHPGALPAQDVALRRRWAELAGGGRTVGEQELRAALAPWAPWHSVVAFYLWFDRWYHRQTGA
jgi:3-methyladenine DNA glycosylase/8-oxoguanine DNA glycosylase